MRKKILLIFFIMPIIISILNVNIVGVTVAQEVGERNIAVVNVTPSSTLVEKGNSVNITVIVENQGTESETFNVTTYHDNTAIDTRTVENLGAGANTSLTVPWSTAKFWDYTSPQKIKAVASTVPNETDTEDNTLISSSRVRVFAPPDVAVVPHSTVNSNLTIDTTYTISIRTDYNGSDITGWQFDLSYNPNILRGVEVTNGDLITNATHPGEAQFIPGKFDNVMGKLSNTMGFFFSPGKVTSGPGILANVTFTVAGLGDSYITLGDDTKLKGWDSTEAETCNIVSDWEPDDQKFHILHGFFQNEEVTHDVAVVSVTVSPTEVVQGEPVNITVVIENQGTVAEEVAVKVYWDYDPAVSVPIETKTVSALAIGENTTVNFTWDTTNMLTTTHTITAIVSGLLGETDTDDNTLRSDETVIVSLDAVYIRPNGSIDPPTAPISTVDNVTYTFSGNIYDEIVVERDNIVVDGAGYSVQEVGGTGIYLYGRNNVTIKSMEVIAGFTGILLKNSSNNSVYGNNMTDNGYGIYLDYSSNNTISGNNITNNHSLGINLAFSSNNTISGNNVSSNVYAGIRLDYSGSNHNEISSNIVSNNNYGIILTDACDNVVLSNVISNNGHTGIYPTSRSANNTFAGNVISNNKWGIQVIGSDKNCFSENEVFLNDEIGIYLSGSRKNILLRNNLSRNYDGISLWDSSNNTICQNNISYSQYGIVLANSSISYFCTNNTIYHNNFINNTKSAHPVSDFPPLRNIWDDGYPSGGNYWSDYEERYPNATEIDDSGIWDTPYVIDENNQDNYPLVEPWSLKPPSPVEATQELIETIETWNLPKGTENSLKAKLKVAIHMLDMGKENGATRKLTAFINRVEMLREKTLTNEQADELVSEAQRIIDLING